VLGKSGKKKSGASGTSNPRRWRIEHAQVVHPFDWAVFGTCDILPSVQPTHAVSDADWVHDRLGAHRLERAYAYQSLWNQNRRLPLGTDFPIEAIDPLRTFRAAVYRSDQSPQAHPSLRLDESLSPEQALRGMTIDAAYAQYRDTQTGTLSVGKWADLVVLDVNLLDCTFQESNRTKVKQTWLRGERVYPRSAGARK
jgi:predicted amidohydrolase YtcJ